MSQGYLASLGNGSASLTPDVTEPIAVVAAGEKAKVHRLTLAFTLRMDAHLIKSSISERRAEAVVATMLLRKMTSSTSRSSTNAESVPS